MHSWGTEGRCAAAGHPQDEVPKNDYVYDYIVFRAADVVDLRIDDPYPSKTGGVDQEKTETSSVSVFFPICFRMKAFGCKCGSTIPIIRERFKLCG